MEQVGKPELRQKAIADLLRSGRLKAPESDTEIEPSEDFGVDATARLDEMRADER